MGSAVEILRRLCGAQQAGKGCRVVGAILLAAAATAGCAARSPVTLTPEGARVQVGAAAPQWAREIGAIEASDGDASCRGVLRPRGSLGQAYVRLRNGAASIGADYVQVLDVMRPRSDGNCTTGEYRIMGTAYRVGEPGQTAPAQDQRRPAVPVAQDPPGTGSGRLNLRWRAPTTDQDGRPLARLTGYRIYYGNASTRASRPPCNAFALSVANATSHQLDGLRVGVRYYVQVTALDGGLESQCSEEASGVAHAE